MTQKWTTSSARNALSIGVGVAVILSSAILVWIAFSYLRNPSSFQSLRSPEAFDAPVNDLNPPFGLTDVDELNAIAQHTTPSDTMSPGRAMPSGSTQLIPVAPSPKTQITASDPAQISLPMTPKTSFNQMPTNSISSFDDQPPGIISAHSPSILGSLPKASVDAPTRLSDSQCIPAISLPAVSLSAANQAPTALPASTSVLSSSSIASVPQKTHPPPSIVSASSPGVLGYLSDKIRALSVAGTSNKQVKESDTVSPSQSADEIRSTAIAGSSLIPNMAQNSQKYHYPPNLPFDPPNISSLSELSRLAERRSWSLPYANAPAQTEHSPDLITPIVPAQLDGVADISRARVEGKLSQDTSSAADKPSFRAECQQRASCDVRSKTLQTRKTSPIASPACDVDVDCDLVRTDHRDGDCLIRGICSSLASAQFPSEESDKALLCSYYKSPDQMTVDQQQRFKSLNDLSRFTIIDYIRWLNMYATDLGQLGDDHLINYQKIYRGDHLNSIRIPMTRRSPPRTAEQYLRMLDGTVRSSPDELTSLTISDIDPYLGSNFSSYDTLPDPKDATSYRVITPDLSKKMNAKYLDDVLMPVTDAGLSSWAI